ncbi:MAG TPA: CopG family transcriptional regulator [Actinomycetales bacterium]|nr:CopG family transcriptional regulator [Actinomycetales bacterium]
MRTTVRLDSEVLAAAQQLCREHHIGLGEAVNRLAKAGLAAADRPRRTPFTQRTADLGLKIDVTDIGEVLELLDQYDAEGRTAGDAEAAG